MDVSTQEMYSELRILARAFMRGERKDHTLSPTDLFHESYFRISSHLKTITGSEYDVRALFALTMRRVLIDHARKRCNRATVQIPTLLQVEASHKPNAKDSDPNEIQRLTLLNDALKKFEEKYPLHAKIVELRVFGGQTLESCGQILGLSAATIQRHWNFSKAWLMVEIKRAEQG